MDAPKQENGKNLEVQKAPTTTRAAAFKMRARGFALRDAFADVIQIQGTLSTAFPGQSPAAKKMKSDILEATFGIRGWTKVCDLPRETLGEGVKAITYLVEQLADTQEQPTNIVQWLADRLEDRRRREPEDDKLDGKNNQGEPKAHAQE